MKQVIHLLLLWPLSNFTIRIGPKCLPTSAIESIPSTLTCITQIVLMLYPASCHLHRRIQLLHCLGTDAHVKLKIRKLLEKINK